MNAMVQTVRRQNSKIENKLGEELIWNPFAKQVEDHLVAQGLQYSIRSIQAHFAIV